MHDVIVVGGGPAGLQAALTLGRMHRSVLLLDSGHYRNETVSHMHNFLTHDGAPPAEFRAKARAELDAYADVQVCDQTVVRVAPSEAGHDVELASGTTVSAHKVILATGVRDELPAVPGLDELWGVDAYGCPFCHGHELSGKPIGILAAGFPAVHVTTLVSRIGSSVTVFGNGAEFTDDELATLAKHGVDVRRCEVRGVEKSVAGVRVALEDGQVEVAGLFVGSGTFSQSAPFAEQLGLKLLDSGCIQVDDFGKTSLPGVFAAGDLAHRPAYPMPLASVLSAAAAGQLAALGAIQELLADDT